MNDDFQDELRLAIRHDEVGIPADTEAAIVDGRRIVRGRRLGWGVAACTVVAAAALLLPGVVQRGVPALPAQPGATVSASPAAGTTLTGTEWNAVKLEGAALRPGTSITLRFGDGWVDGSGGCNHFGYTTVDGKIDAGRYRQDGDRLTIAPVATTTMGCADGTGDQEGRFLQVLPKVERFAISSGGLVLQLFGADGGVLLKLEPAAPKLERSGWTVTAIKGSPPVVGTQPRLVFLKGALYGNDGCNAVNGTFSAAGNLSITVSGGTLKLCTDAAVTTQAQEFSAALEGASRVLVQGGQLTLLGRAGTPLLQATSDPALMLATEGFTWRLDNKDGRWGSGNNSPITLRIGTDQLSGNSGCGDYTARFTHVGDVWTVQEPDVEPVPCPSDAGDPAWAFLSLLATVGQVEIADRQLRLITPDEILSFAPR